MLEGDRRERIAQRRFEAEQDLERERAAARATDPDGLNGVQRRRPDGPQSPPNT
jgi:hypothetical protein